MIVAALLTLLANGGPPREIGASPPAGAASAGMVELDWQQKPGTLVPLDLEFRDERGQPLPLRSLTRGKPLVLVLAYYRCPQLCNLVLNGLADAMRGMPLAVGDDYDVITVSFDGRETAEIAAAKKETYLAGLGKPSATAHWHFLTGDDLSIRELADTVGFRYRFDAERDRFDHASGIIILTPDGRVSRYLFGIRFLPRDLRLALVEASAGQVGGMTEQLLLYCFDYDAARGKYGLAVLSVMRYAAAATVAAIVVFVLRAWRRERRRAALPCHSERSEESGGAHVEAS